MVKKMNKIEKLIDELCPDGVDFKELVKVCDIADNKRKPVKSSLRVPGETPYYGANNIQDYVEGFTHDGEYVLIAEDGSASLKKYSIQYVEGKFWANNHVHVVRGNGELNNKFLFHYLRSMNFIPFLSGDSRAKLTKAKMIEIKIPIPPLIVQEEIVKILDNFTTLEAELEAELEARKKQYEYYREELVNLRDGVEYVNLVEVVSMNRGVRVVKSQLEEIGTCPVYQNSMKPLGYYEKSNNLADTTFIISAGAAGEVGYSNVDFWAADDCFALICSDNLRSRFLYYYLKTQQDFLFSRVRRASVPRLSRSVIEKIQIPIPSLSEQDRIVDILDKFDALVNDISIGLPAELNARRKQYEYYRGKLLDFKPLNSEWKESKSINI